jgi:GNAT superfamily N-acetyltransferase
MTATTRPARPGDEADILRLIQALADNEREPDVVEATAKGCVHTCSPTCNACSPTSPGKTGASSGSPCGSSASRPGPKRTASISRTYFVDPAARGVGVARRLIRALAAEARGRVVFGLSGRCSTGTTLPRASIGGWVRTTTRVGSPAARRRRARGPATLTEVLVLAAPWRLVRLDKHPLGTRISTNGSPWSVSLAPTME